jgi:DNA-binding NarL/FixJ family response regulator
VKTAIVEDHVMMGDVLHELCAKEFGCDVVLQAAHGRSAIEAIVSAAPDVLLLDLMLDDISGFEIVDELKNRSCAPRILAISSRCDDFTVYLAEQEGFFGFVDKTSATLEQLREAVGSVLSGRPYYSQRFLDIQERRRNDPDAFDKVLTQREQSILTMISGSLTDREIGARLGISEHTAQKHRFNILRKLKLESRTSLLRYAEDHGMTPYTPAYWRIQ